MSKMMPLINMNSPKSEKLIKFLPQEWIHK